MKEVKKETKPMIKLTLLTGVKNITDAINQVNVQGKALEKLIHTVAVSILAHVEQHREVSLVNKLIDAIPNLARKNALRDWFTSFSGNIVFDKETKVMTFKKTGKTDVSGATQVPFWEFKPEGEYIPFDLLAAVTTLVSRAEKAKEQGNKQDKIPTDVLANLRKIVA